MTVVSLLEAKDSLAKASTPEPFSTSKTSNWVARGGGLPDYIQHIAHDLMEKRGKSESNAIEMAVGIVKRWARGGGNVDANTRAAAAKAVAEWEKLKAGSHAKSALQHADDPPTLASEIALREIALADIARMNERVGPAGLVRLVESAGGLMEAASEWQPSLKRVASASEESERHAVMDGGQKVGMVACRDRMGPVGRGRRWQAFAVNGSRLGEYDGKPSRDEAIKVLHKHLQEAPARVLAFPTTGEFLVAKPSSYSGNMTYESFPSEGAARHAAGLPANPTAPEQDSKIARVAEELLFDLAVVSGLDIPPLAAVQEARRRLPFDASDRLAEAFHPDEVRGYHGRWVRGANLHGDIRHLELSKPTSPSRVTPGPRVPRRAGRPVATEKYQGGVVRESAKLRAAHAAKPQLSEDELKKIATQQGEWSSSAARAARDIRAGKVADTEQAHRAKNPDGALGAYSAERQKLHEQIITSLLQGKGVHAHPEAVFTAGGGGSGKSAMVKSGHVKVPKDAVRVDPDLIKAMLPEYEMLGGGNSGAPGQVHEESSHIAKALMRLALGRGHHALIDGTGNSGAGKFAGKIKAAQKAGHKVTVNYAHVSVEEALKRNQKRARTVAPQVIRDAHQGVSARFPEVERIPGIGLKVFDTTERTPRVIAERRAGSDKLHIVDRAAHQAHLDKGKGG